LKARELFGFNIGSFQELPTGDLCTICFPTQKKCVRIQYGHALLVFPATLFIQYSGVPLGDASSVTDQLPWIIQSDLDLVVLVSSGSDGNPSTEIMTVSEVFCWITRTHGATEALMMDHNVSPMLKETGLTNHYTWFCCL
jgi:hypothetical protein